MSLSLLNRRAANCPVNALPERILQFGEGNFLRGFVDWMVQTMNRQGRFSGRVVIVQPLERGMVEQLNQQDGLYTLLLRGMENGRPLEKRELISAVSRGIDPYTHYQAFLECARNPDLRFVVSNTTEAGIACDPLDRAEDKPPKSFPAKVTALLRARYEFFHGAGDRGLVFLPCELIEANGQALRQAILHTARAWDLPDDFTRWVGEACVFADTLVDRIVTGYPHADAAKLNEQLGYEDKLLDSGEIFHLWVIQAPRELARKLALELPLEQCGLNVIWTDDLRPYRQRKVRILNGGHTLMVPPAFLAGKDFVGQCMADAAIRGFLQDALQQEIIPTLNLPRRELDEFAAAVLERFANPYIQHPLLSIALNSISKFKVRLLPSLLDYHRQTGQLPQRICFSLAALFMFYRGEVGKPGTLNCRRTDRDYVLQDDEAVMRIFAQAWTQFDQGAWDLPRLAQSLLAQTDWWETDLNVIAHLTDAVAKHMQAIQSMGAMAAMGQLGK